METCAVMPEAAKSFTFRPSYEGWKLCCSGMRRGDKPAFRPSYEGWKHQYVGSGGICCVTFRPSYEGWKLLLGSRPDLLVCSF